MRAEDAYEGKLGCSLEESRFEPMAKLTDR